MAPKTETAIAETTQPITSPEQASEAMAALIEAAVRKSVGTAGPIPAFFINMFIGQLIRPIVDTLASIIAHIGMAVPNALGDLVEKLESGVGFDLNGDGFVGDPEVKADDK